MILVEAVDHEKLEAQISEALEIRDLRINGHSSDSSASMNEGQEKHSQNNKLLDHRRVSLNMFF